MPPISKMASQIMSVARLSSSVSSVGVSRIKASIPAPASFKTPEPAGVKKQTESCQDQATSEGLNLDISLTKLPRRRWETEFTESKNRVSIINKL